MPHVELFIGGLVAGNWASIFQTRRQTRMYATTHQIEWRADNRRACAGLRKRNSPATGEIHESNKMINFKFLAIRLSTLDVRSAMPVAHAGAPAT